MDRLRVALGAARIDYYGLSYGTVLGSVYRQLFPDHVRAMVLDGAVDANLSLAADATAEAPAIQTALERGLAGCTASPGCPLGADPVAFYRSLQQRLSRSPLPAPGGGDHTPVTEGDLGTATLLYLSVPTLTPGFFPALASAAAGDGAPLRSVALGLETDLDAKSLVGPLWAITCNDARGHPGGATTARLARSLEARFPLGGAEAVANNLIACPGWVGSVGAVHLSPNRAPVPLVIGNTDDPNTPYVSARHLAVGHRRAIGHLRGPRAHLAAQRLGQPLPADRGRRVLRRRRAPGSPDALRVVIRWPPAVGAGDQRETSGTTVASLLGSDASTSSPWGSAGPLPPLRA